MSKSVYSRRKTEQAYSSRNLCKPRSINIPGLLYQSAVITGFAANVSLPLLLLKKNTFAHQCNNTFSCCRMIQNSRGMNQAVGREVLRFACYLNCYYSGACNCWLIRLSTCILSLKRMLATSTILLGEVGGLVH